MNKTKVKSNIAKVGAVAMGLMLKAQSVFATEDVTITGNGGEIRKSALGQGVYKMANDVSGTLRWLIPIVSIPFILWFLIKMLTGDEQEQPRYKKRLITTLVVVMASTLVTVIINLVMGYFVS